MISVSFLKSKFNRLETIKKINETNAEFLHVDIMDGKFVKNVCNNDILELVEELKVSNKKIDIHLMCECPASYISLLSELKPEYITIHVEIKNVEYYLNLIKEKGIKAGLAINPSTEPDVVLKYNPDYVLVMGVEPGAGGQQLKDENVLKAIVLNNNKILCGIDGGVNNETIEKLNNFDIIVSGSYICMSDDYQERINSLR